jgi:DNA-binding transcriptional regulator YiaG
MSGAPNFPLLTNPTKRWQDAAMQLKQFLDANKLKYGDFAKLIDVSPEAVRLWVSGERVPSRRRMETIREVTKGAVQPNDFYAAA